VRNLLRLFGTRFATVQLLHDGMIEMPAAGGQPGFERIMESYPLPVDDSTVGGQAMLSKLVVQYSPVVGNLNVPPQAQQIARDSGYDSIIAAPMIRQDKVIGAIVCLQHERRVFEEKEVTLIKSFADQAVIAIENDRLFTDCRRRRWQRHAYRYHPRYRPVTSRYHLRLARRRHRGAAAAGGCGLRGPMRGYRWRFLSIRPEWRRRLHSQKHHSRLER
jgi:GAF domain-containing protein